MGKFQNAFQNLYKQVFRRKQSAQNEQLVKSLRDGALSGDVGGANAGVNIIQIGNSRGETSRLFQKRNANTLRAYAEFSIWVRAAIDIYPHKPHTTHTPHLFINSPYAMRVFGR